MSVEVTLRYWAGARAAAGVESESVSAETVASALDLASTNRPGLGSVIDRSSILMNGRNVSAEQRAEPLQEAALVEVLPPFAGG